MKSVILLSAIFGASTLGVLADPQSDHEKETAYRGAWMIDPGTTDTHDKNFLNSGYEAIGYNYGAGLGIAFAIRAGKTCERASDIIRVKWRIESGVLITDHLNGKSPDHDMMVEITTVRYVVHPSSDYSRTLTRIKTNRCDKEIFELLKGES